MELILITNNPGIAALADASDVDRIMVDLETIGKSDRQRHRNTVLSNHCLSDVTVIRKVLKRAKLMVRVNPVHAYSRHEIRRAIQRGADILMLPMFRRAEEVSEFLDIVDGKARTCLLLETSQALVRLDDILLLKGIDEVHVGLNDLHLCLGLDFLFELVAHDTVESIARKVRAKGIRFGFGGVARLGEGSLDPSLVLSEHVRLGSEIVILSRTFHGGSGTLKELQSRVDLGAEVSRLRQELARLQGLDAEALLRNRQRLCDAVKGIVKGIATRG